MIKKLLVVITLATVVIACGDKKKDNKETPKVCVEALAESADSLVALDEVTLVGKLGLCPVSNEDVVLAGKGALVKVVPAEGVNVDTLLFGKPVAVTGKLSVEVLDSAAVAVLEANVAEKKAACEKAKEEKKAACEKAKEEKKVENAEAETKSCCAKKEGKTCCSAPKAGDKLYTVTVTKIEAFECPEKDEKSCEKEGEKTAEEQVPEQTQEQE